MQRSHYTAIVGSADMEAQASATFTANQEHWCIDKLVQSNNTYRPGKVFLNSVALLQLQHHVFGMAGVCCVESEQPYTVHINYKKCFFSQHHEMQPPPHQAWW